jgi:hypothetical protein
MRCCVRSQAGSYGPCLFPIARSSVMSLWIHQAAIHHPPVDLSCLFPYKRLVVYLVRLEGESLSPPMREQHCLARLWRNGAL